MLSCSNTRGYELLNSGELVSFKDGKSRKITVASIKDYITRRTATPSELPRRKRGRPRKSPSIVERSTKATRAARRAAIGSDAELKRLASYEGITPEQFVRLARTVYGKFWQGPLAADMMMSRQGVIRWAKGKHKISPEKERLLLLLCLRRVRAAHALVRAMYRGAVAAETARQQLAAMPRYKPLTRQRQRGTIF